jgi:glycosyltransferase involved in cell wall biosynthesis
MMAGYRILLVSHSGQYCSAGSLLLYAAATLGKIAEVHLHFPLDAASPEVMDRYRALDIPVLGSPQFNDYDLVVANCQKLAAYINEVLACFKTPVALWIHESWAHRSPVTLRKAAERCCALIFQSPYQSDTLYGRLLGDIGIPAYFIPNTAIIVSPVTTIGDQVPPSIVSVGALIPRKRQIDCVRAVAALDREIICYLVGKESSPGLAIREITSAYHKRFVFSGHLNTAQAQAAIAKATIVVQPSESESQPLTLLEAMYYAKPMIVADIPPYRYMGLVSELNCLMYPLGDVERLRHTLDSAIGHPEHAHELGQNAQKLFATNFHPALFRRRVCSTVGEILDRLRP